MQQCKQWSRWRPNCQPVPHWLAITPLIQSQVMGTFIHHKKTKERVGPECGLLENVAGAMANSDESNIYLFIFFRFWVTIEMTTSHLTTRMCLLFGNFSPTILDYISQETLSSWLFNNEDGNLLLSQQEITSWFHCPNNWTAPVGFPPRCEGSENECLGNNWWGLKWR